MKLETSRGMRVGIADGDAARSDALARAIDAEPRLELAGAVRTGPEALELLAAGNVDVLLIGLRMKGLDGLTTLRMLGRTGSTTPVVLAAEVDVERMLDAVALGAAGFLSLADRERLAHAGLHSYLAELLGARPADRLEPIVAAPAPEGRHDALITLPAGRIAGLGELLRSGTVPLRSAVYALLDAPGWLLPPLARRLHRNTPWRVLGAREGDVLAPGHVLVATLDSGLVPIPDGRRVRVARRNGWGDLREARMAISHATSAHADPTNVPTTRAA